jgi:hypothetical protein
MLPRHGNRLIRYVNRHAQHCYCSLDILNIFLAIAK